MINREGSLSVNIIQKQRTFMRWLCGAWTEQRLCGKTRIRTAAAKRGTIRIHFMCDQWKGAAIEYTDQGKAVEGGTS